MLWSKLCIVILMQAVFSYFFGRMMIPILRRQKTGRYDPYIGDRFALDGSEPSFGGVGLCLCFCLGACAAATFCDPKRLFAAAVFVILITLVGVFEDLHKEVRRQNYLISSGIKFGCCFAVCLLFLLIYRSLGVVKTQILLPFRLGYIELYEGYYPVMAAAMSVMISAGRQSTRFGTDDKSSVEGLSQTLIFVHGISFALLGAVISDDTASALGYVTAAAAGGGLIWGLSPAKQKIGSSGGYFCGAAAALTLCFCPYTAVAAVVGCLVILIDAASSGLQYLVYRKSKKLLLKGSSLHAHLRAKGMSDYKIILLFAAAAAVCAAGETAYAVYADSIIL